MKPKICKIYHWRTCLYLFVIFITLTAGMPMGCGTMCMMVAVAPVAAVKDHAYSARETEEFNLIMNRYADKNKDSIVDRTELEIFLAEAKISREDIDSIPQAKKYILKEDESIKNDSKFLVKKNKNQISVYSLKDNKKLFSKKNDDRVSVYLGFMALRDVRGNIYKVRNDIVQKQRREAMERIEKFFDTNNDGRLDKNEAEKLIALFPDKKTRRTEIMNYYERHSSYYDKGFKLHQFYERDKVFEKGCYYICIFDSEQESIEKFIKKAEKKKNKR